MFFSVTCELFFVAHFMLLLLLRSGDIAKYPGSKKSSVVKFCHWNLNGLPAHDFVKIPLIEAKFVYLKRFWIPQYPQNDENININGYNY